MDRERVGFYFRSALPAASGFSAYRMPGPIVHLAVTLLALAAGVAICVPGEAMTLAPLILVWLVAGFYVGRDLALLAHYRLGLGFGLIGGVFALAVVPGAAQAAYAWLAGLSGAHFPELAIVATVVVAVGFALWIPRAAALLFEDPE